MTSSIDLPTTSAPGRAPVTPEGHDGASSTPRPSGVTAMLWALALTAAALAGTLLLPPLITGGLLLGMSTIYLARRILFRWDTALIALVAVIMFVPVRRYSFPVPLSFALEPYRVAIVVLLAAQLIALWSRGSFTWRSVHFRWSLGLFVFSVFISIPTNAQGLISASLAKTSVSALVNLLVMLSVFLIVRLLLDGEKKVALLLQCLVWAGAIVGFFAVVERVTHVNVFLRLNRFLPLDLLRDAAFSYRAGGSRSYASSQHPIALSVMLCMLVPLAIYLAKHSPWPRNLLNRRIVYGGAAFLMVAGVGMAVSRTATISIAVVLLATLLLRPHLGISMVIAAIPVAAIGAVAVPEVFTELIGSFLDVDTLVASQYTSAGSAGAGRLADLGPAMSLAAQHPFFGTGVGARIVVGDDANSFILDNQVLGTLLDTGIVGVIGLICLTIVPMVALVRLSFRADVAERHRDLAFAFAMALLAYIAALYFYDAFGFLQTFFVFCMVLAGSAWLLSERAGDDRDDVDDVDDQTLAEAAP